MVETTLYQQATFALGVAALAGFSGSPVDCPTIDAATVVRVNVLDPTKLARLYRLADNWDEEGAPRPSQAALQRADSLIRWAHESGLVVNDVDADVLGGVGIWLRAHAVSPALSAWIAFMNNGNDTVVMSEARAVTGHAAWDGSDATRVAILDFLKGARRGQAVA